jgi:hypothetical protein
MRLNRKAVSRLCMANESSAQRCLRGSVPLVFGLFTQRADRSLTGKPYETSTSRSPGWAPGIAPGSQVLADKVFQLLPVWSGDTGRAIAENASEHPEVEAALRSGPRPRAATCWEIPTLRQGSRQEGGVRRSNIHWRFDCSDDYRF